jgi:hypothetical protein
LYLPLSFDYKNKFFVFLFLPKTFVFKSSTADHKKLLTWNAAHIRLNVAMRHIGFHSGLAKDDANNFKVFMFQQREVSAQSARYVDTMTLIRRLIILHCVQKVAFLFFF